MQAARIHGFGNPDVVGVDDVPAPGSPGGDRIAVRVRASSINGTDLGLRRGDLRIAAVGLPHTLGFDLAGEVVRCGPRVTAFAPGDQVMALLGHGGGGQAELVTLRQHRAARAPRTVDAAAASALPLAGLTALQALYRAGGLHGRFARPGQRPRVLVTGASGGIGSCAVQLAARAGAHVTAVTTGPHREWVATLGAAETVDRDLHDVANLEDRWDLLLDTHGGLGFLIARRLLRPGGVHVSTRPVSRDLLHTLAPARQRPGRRRHRAVATIARSQDLARLAALVDDGSLQVPVDRRFPLHEVAAAHAHAEGRHARGKTVVTLE